MTCTEQKPVLYPTSTFVSTLVENKTDVRWWCSGDIHGSECCIENLYYLGEYDVHSNLCLSCLHIPTKCEKSHNVCFYYVCNVVMHLWYTSNEVERKLVKNLNVLAC